jgi:hypothetical protein
MAGRWIRNCSRMKLINKYKELLGLDDWNIITEPIQKEQVTYDNDVPEEDKYFIGIRPEYNNKTATIYHDRDLTEEDIAHELLHVKFPSVSESGINELTKILIK